MKKTILLFAILLGVVACTKEVEVETIVYREDVSITNDLRAQISSLESQINSLNAENASVGAELMAAVIALDGATDHIHELEEQIAAIAEERDQLLSQTSALEAQVADLEEQLGETQAEVVTNSIASGNPLSVTTEEPADYILITEEHYTDGRVRYARYEVEESQIGTDLNGDGDLIDFFIWTQIFTIVDTVVVDYDETAEIVTNVNYVELNIVGHPRSFTRSDQVDVDVVAIQNKIDDFNRILEVVDNATFTNLFNNTRITYFTANIGGRFGNEGVVVSHLHTTWEQYIMLHEFGHAYHNIQLNRPQWIEDLYEKVLSDLEDDGGYYRVNSSEFFAEMFATFVREEYIAGTSLNYPNGGWTGSFTEQYYNEEIRPIFLELFND